jgi:hypothetical protein
VLLQDGKVEVNVESQGRTSRKELYVVAEKYDGRLGQIWIHHLGISFQETDSEQLVNSRASGVLKVDFIDDIISRYSENFQETVSCIPRVKVSLRLRDKAKPIFQKKREVPYDLCDKVYEELDTLESQGII